MHKCRHGSKMVLKNNLVMKPKKLNVQYSTQFDSHYGVLLSLSLTISWKISKTVKIDQCLKYYDHLDYITGSLNKIVYIYPASSRDNVNQNILRVVHLANFQSIFNYVNIFWGLSLMHKKISIVQKMIIKFKIICRMKYRKSCRRTYSDNLTFSFLLVSTFK